MEVNRDLKQPVYLQIYTILHDELERGIYNGCEVLPSEKKLCERFNVERNTVRRALQLMVEDGSVEKAPGFGTRIIANFSRNQGRTTGGEKGAETARKTILMITQETNPFGSEVEYFHLTLMRLLEKSISDMGCNMMFKSMNDNSDLDEVIRHSLPAAILFDSYMDTEHYSRALLSGLPCVSVNHYTPLITSVVSNNFGGAYQVAKALTDAGHEKIALITGKQGYQTTIERLRGFRSLCQEKGVFLDEKYIFTGNWLFESGYEIGGRILEMSPAERPTAVFAFNDDLAYGCLSRFEKNGVSVPDQISVAGFDRSERYKRMFRPITTVDVNIQLIVKYTCWYLSSRLRGTAPESPARIEIDTRIADGGTIRNLKE